MRRIAPLVVAVAACVGLSGCILFNGLQWRYYEYDVAPGKSGVLYSRTIGRTAATELAWWWADHCKRSGSCFRGIVEGAFVGDAMRDHLLWFATLQDASLHRALDEVWANGGCLSQLYQRATDGVDPTFLWIRNKPDAQVCFGGASVVPRSVDTMKPRVDLFLTDSYTTVPCTRSESDGKARYFCRVRTSQAVRSYFTIAPGDVRAAHYVRRGDVEGGGNYSLTDVNGSLYEACRWLDQYGSRTNVWGCAQQVLEYWVKEYSTSARDYYVGAFWRWFADLATAAECLHALYERDPFEIANSCQ